MHLLFLPCYNHIMPKGLCGIDGVEDQQSGLLASVLGCGILLFSSSMGNDCLLVSLEGWFFISCGWCFCWSLESVFDKMQPFLFLSLYLGPVSIFAKLKICLAVWFVTKKCANIAWLDKLKNYSCYYNVVQKPLPNLNPLLIWIHASEWRTPRLIRHSKVYFVFSVITSV